MRKKMGFRAIAIAAVVVLYGCENKVNPTTTLYKYNPGGGDVLEICNGACPSFCTYDGGPCLTPRKTIPLQDALNYFEASRRTHEF
jgi:hypothetical protein